MKPPVSTGFASPRTMSKRIVQFITLLGLAALAAGGARAQSPQCGGLWREIAAIERGAPNPARAAQHGQAATRIRMEMGQVIGALQVENCDSRNAMFNAPPSPQCSSLKVRYRQLGAQLTAAENAMREADGDPQIREARRRQLHAMLDGEGCNKPEQARGRGPIESLFSGSQRFDPRPPEARGLPGVIEILPDGTMPGAGIRADPMYDAPYQPRAQSERAVCVRSCDGYFFPLDISAFRARADGDELCGKLCPGTKTEVYFLPPGAAIEQAANTSGDSYTALPNASRYKQVYDAACACKPRTETWAGVLRGAEQTFERVQEAEAGDAAKQQKALPRPAAGSAKQPAATAAPDAPKLPANAKIVGAGEGETHETNGNGGTRRAVRNVAPEFAPPKAAQPGLRLQ